MKAQNITTNEMSNGTSRIGKTTLAVLLAVNLWVVNAQAETTPPAKQPVDPATHAAHVASGVMPPDAVKGDPAILQQLSQIQAKIVQLEAALAKSKSPPAASPAGAAMPGMQASVPAPSSPTGMGMGMDKMKSGGMPGMSANATPAPAMAGMSGAAAAPGGSMKMMGMMDKMMGMMDKMMPMGGGPMAMGDDKMEMGGMGAGAMPAPAPAAPMSGGMGMGMGDDKMEMGGMMGMGGAMSQSALPGFPGASHLYHIGATGFFLDHRQHITLTTEQQAGLNKAKEQALLAKSTSDRAVEQAEQALWTLTAADQPDVAGIEAKIAEIGKLTGERRLAFIRAVGEASKLLTDEQRKSLTGFAPPVSTPPAAAPMAGGMKHM